MPESGNAKKYGRRAEAEAPATRVEAKKVKAPASGRGVRRLHHGGMLGVWHGDHSRAGQSIPFMTELGNWNILIGMGGMAAAFVIATLWK